jgi:hypothetical protein
MIQGSRSRKKPGPSRAGLVLLIILITALIPVTGGMNLVGEIPPHNSVVPVIGKNAPDWVTEAANLSEQGKNNEALAAAEQAIALAVSRKHGREKVCIS